METINTLTVEAIYQNGVIKPIIDIPLQENEQIRIQIERKLASAPDKAWRIVHLRGIWKNYLSAEEEEGDWVFDTIAAIRHESNRKVEKLAHEIGEALSNA
jgi:predicted DNA-binding antitoxin AbrB/MazE fold protein